jgi:hypothetical protein
MDSIPVSELPLPNELPPATPQAYSAFDTHLHRVSATANCRFCHAEAHELRPMLGYVGRVCVRCGTTTLFDPAHCGLRIISRPIRAILPQRIDTAIVFQVVAASEFQEAPTIAPG